MKLKQLLRTTAAAAFLLWAGAANAALYNFSLSGAYTASWQLDASPVPDVAIPANGFSMWNVSGHFPGAQQGLVDLVFFLGDGGGGLQIEDFYGAAILATGDGPQLYTGSESAPVFKLGTFTLSQFQGSGSYTLTVSAVPEPATGAMLLGGLGLVGLAVRRRRA